MKSVLIHDFYHTHIILQIICFWTIKKKSCSPQIINEQNKKKNWMCQPLDMGIKRMVFIWKGWFQHYFMKSLSDQYCGRYFCFSSI